MFACLRFRRACKSTQKEVFTFNQFFFNNSVSLCLTQPELFEYQGQAKGAVSTQPASL